MSLYPPLCKHCRKPMQRQDSNAHSILYVCGCLGSLTHQVVQYKDVGEAQPVAKWAGRGLVKR